MLALADPYGTENAPYYTRDLSLYGGHYYFYNGPAPIVTFMAPFRLLTGWFPTEGLASVVFEIVGVLATLLLLVEWRRQAGGETSATVHRLAMLMAIVGSGGLVWIAEVGPVQLSDISGSAWLSVMLLAGFRARTSPRGTRWLAAASLAYGLAVASRPALLFTGLALPVLAWPAVFARPAQPHGRARRAARVAALLLPAAAIGAALAWLNYARFGSPFEFGQRFFLSHLGDMRDYPQFSWRWLSGDLRAALLNLPHVIGRPPFLAVGWREPVGLLVMPYLYGALALLRRDGRHAATRDLAIATAVVAATIAAPLAFFFVHWSRYWTEVLVPATLLASLGWMRLASAAAPRWRRHVTVAAVAAAAAQCWLLSTVFLETMG